MKRWLGIGLVLLCHGCVWDVYKVFPHRGAQFDNRSAYDNQLFLQVWAETERLAGVDIDLEGMTVVIYEDVRDFKDACPDMQTLGCTDFDNIYLRGSIGTDFVEVGTAFTHLLGHVYLQRAGVGVDGSHAHDEWFGPDGTVVRIQHLIAGGAIQ